MVVVSLMRSKNLVEPYLETFLYKSTLLPTH